jgi:hypothetical protein
LSICLLPANVYAPLATEVFLMEELSKCQKLIEKFSEGKMLISWNLVWENDEPGLFLPIPILAGYGGSQLINDDLFC